MILPHGFRYGGISCGIKKGGALDLALIFSDLPCAAAAVFTQNRFAAAPVLYDRQLLALNREMVHAVLINSGNANAVTGAQGLAHSRRSAEAVEAVFGLSSWSTLVMSTGVIGVPLPVDRIEAAMPSLFQSLGSGEAGFMAAVQAIMTTDTRPKFRATSVQIDHHEVTIAGMAKGAGMIHPQMATMLAVLTTDAPLSPAIAQLALNEAVAQSFNRISVDGDTSTNDTVVLLANGASGQDPITDTKSGAYARFVDALVSVCMPIAQDIVRDGEGATRLVTIHVSGAEDDLAAHRIANAIAISPLVKTAIYGGDANWGRVLMAAGNAQVPFDPATVALWFAGHPGGSQEQFQPLQVLAGGAVLDYDEAIATRHFSQPELLIDLRLGEGPGSATVWTCDLSHEYVTINGEYRS